MKIVHVACKPSFLSGVAADVIIVIVDAVVVATAAAFTWFIVLQPSLAEPPLIQSDPKCTQSQRNR